jgi:hypothetical protein
MLIPNPSRNRRTVCGITISADAFGDHALNCGACDVE